MRGSPRRQTQFGKNVVVGNLVYSLVLGMSVPDVSGAGDRQPRGRVAPAQDADLPRRHDLRRDEGAREEGVAEQARPRHRERRDPGLQPARRGGLLLPPQGDGAEAGSGRSPRSARTSRPSRSAHDPRRSVEAVSVRSRNSIGGVAMSSVPPPPPPPPPPSGGPPSGRLRPDVGAAVSYGWKKFHGVRRAADPDRPDHRRSSTSSAASSASRSTIAVPRLILWSGSSTSSARSLTIGIINASLMVTRGETPDVGKAFSTERLGRVDRLLDRVRDHRRHRPHPVRHPGDHRSRSCWRSTASTSSTRA